MTQNPPSSLSPAASAWWKAIISQFILDDAGSLLILEQTLLAFDRAEAARRQIDADGLSRLDGGRPVKHPLLGTEHACRAQVLAGFRLLNLDPGTAPAPRIGRPTGGRS